MTTEGSSLLVRAAGWTCALPITEVSETMRELDHTPCAGAPAWVLGASVIRGQAVPVVDLASFLGGEPSADRGRFVTVRTNGSFVALRVDAVVGVARLDADARPTSPLLGSVESRRTVSLATLDQGLLAVLELSELVPTEIHDALRLAEAS